MSLILTLDNGNTNPHVGLFKNRKLLEVIPLSHLADSANLMNEEKIKIIISDVGKSIDLPKNIVLERPPLKISKLRENKSFLKMPVNYTETLGEDRLCQSYFAFKTSQVFPTVVVDAGTFTTVDFIDEQGLQGGLIFPGAKTFLNSYGKGQNLPLLSLEENTSTKTLIKLPQDTDLAIKKGLEVFLRSIYDFVLNDLCPKNVILTGGLAHTLLPFFKNGKLKVQLEPYYIHNSLFSVLEGYSK